MIVSPRIDQALAQDPNRELRIGIMGGTFDPIHYGHLICAEQAREQFELDCVLFMPTGIPAFKQTCKVTSPLDRYEMVKLAICNHESFDVSRLEVDRDGVTYTYETLHELIRLLPDSAKLFFITGADAILSVLKWRNAAESMKLAHFVAATRPGYDYTELREEMASNSEIAHAVSFFEVPGLAISSTDMRQRVRDGKSIAYMTPFEVEGYIVSHGLYRD